MDASRLSRDFSLSSSNLSPDCCTFVNECSGGDFRLLLALDATLWSFAALFIFKSLFDTLVSHLLRCFLLERLVDEFCLDSDEPLFPGKVDGLEVGSDADAPEAGSEDDLGRNGLSFEADEANSIVSSSLLHSIEKS